MRTLLALTPCAIYSSLRTCFSSIEQTIAAKDRLTNKVAYYAGIAYVLHCQNVKVSIAFFISVDGFVIFFLQLIV